MIYQTLQEGTKARPGRKVEIVNLGLDAEEALEMGLAAEKLDRKGTKAISVAAYIEEEWAEWLQSNRVELNAMNTPKFLEWLDSKMEQFSGKLIPPAAVLSARLDDEVRALTRQRLVDDAIRAARVQERTETAMVNLRPRLTTTAQRLLPIVEADLSADTSHHWTAPVGKLAGELVKDTAVTNIAPNL